MSKLKDRDYYRLTLPGGLIRRLAEHYPAFVSEDGSIDDVSLMTAVGAEWLRIISGGVSSTTLSSSAAPASQQASATPDIVNEEDDDLPIPID